MCLYVVHFSACSIFFRCSLLFELLEFGSARCVVNSGIGPMPACANVRVCTNFAQFFLVCNRSEFLQWKKKNRTRGTAAKQTKRFISYCVLRWCRWHFSFPFHSDCTRNDERNIRMRKHCHDIILYYGCAHNFFFTIVFFVSYCHLVGEENVSHVSHIYCFELHRKASVLKLRTKK